MCTKLLYYANLAWAALFGQNLLALQTLNFSQDYKPMEVQAIKLKNNQTLLAWAEINNEMNSYTSIRTHYALKTSTGFADLGYYSNPQFAVSVNPAIAECPDGSVYRVSMNISLDYKTATLDISGSQDGGTTWAAWHSLYRKTKGGIVDKPALICDGKNHLYVAFVDLKIDPEFDSGALKWTKSIDQGKSWSLPEVLVSRQQLADPANQLAPQGVSFAKDAQHNISLVYSEYASCFTNGIRGRISSKKLLPSGQWSKSAEIFDGKNLTDSIFSCTWPPLTSFAISPSGKYMIASVYVGHDLNSKPIFVISKDFGATWSQKIILPDNGSQVDVKIDDEGNFSLAQNSLNQSVYKVMVHFGNVKNPNILTTKNVYQQRQNGSGQAYIGGYQSLLSDFRSRTFELYFFTPSGIPFESFDLKYIADSMNNN